jgi:hypothetical protein
MRQDGDPTKPNLEAVGVIVSHQELLFHDGNHSRGAICALR